MSVTFSGVFIFSGSFTFSGATNALRGHVNKFVYTNPKSLWKGVGGSSVQLEKKFGKPIFIHYFITFLGEHSNVVLASMYRYSWLITIEIFRNFFG